jgi:hypothetical protein
LKLEAEIVECQKLAEQQKAKDKFIEQRQAEGEAPFVASSIAPTAARPPCSLWRPTLLNAGRRGACARFLQRARLR